MIFLYPKADAITMGIWGRLPKKSGMAKKFSELLAKIPEERRRKIRAEACRMEQEMALSDLRRARSLTQAQLAGRLGIKQPSVADMEKGADMHVSTLRALIEGMGGELEVIAKFPGANVRIKNFSNI